MLYRLTKLAVGPVLRAYFHVRAEGVGNVPSEGAAILACNHLSFLDSFFTPLVLDRRVTYVAKAEYFEHWYTRILFEGWGQIPIRREGGRAGEEALSTAADVLAAGEVFGIYPEGTRSPDGKLHRGRTGVARLALRTGAPVVPVGLIGTYEVFPKGRKIPKRGSVTVRFGKPLVFRGTEDRARAVTDEIMYEIRALSGQEYVDEYASTRSSDAAPIEEVALARIKSAKSTTKPITPGRERRAS